MSTDHEVVRPGSDIDIAIDRALEAAQLRVADGATTSTVGVAGDREPFAPEAFGAVDAADGE